MSLINIDITRIKTKFAAYKTALAQVNIALANISNFRTRPLLPVYISDDTSYNTIVDQVADWELHNTILQGILTQARSQLSTAEKAVINEMPINQWIKYDTGTYIGVSNELLQLRIVTTPPTGAFPSS